MGMVESATNLRWFGVVFQFAGPLLFRGMLSSFKKMSGQWRGLDLTDFVSISPFLLTFFCMMVSVVNLRLVLRIKKMSAREKERKVLLDYLKEAFTQDGGERAYMAILDLIGSSRDDRSKNCATFCWKPQITVVVPVINSPDGLRQQQKTRKELEKADSYDGSLTLFPDDTTVVDGEIPGTSFRDVASLGNFKDDDVPEDVVTQFEEYDLPGMKNDIDKVGEGERRKANDKDEELKATELPSSLEMDLKTIEITREEEASKVFKPIDRGERDAAAGLKMKEGEGDRGGGSGGRGGGSGGKPNMVSDSLQKRSAKEDKKERSAGNEGGSKKARPERRALSTAQKERKKEKTLQKMFDRIDHKATDLRKHYELALRTALKNSQVVDDKRKDGKNVNRKAFLMAYPAVAEAAADTKRNDKLSVK